MTKKIPLGKSKKSALVDDEDYEFLIQNKWYFMKTEQIGGYASTHITGKTIYMHRIVNKTPEGFFTDHINGDKLDNRKSNLRTATERQNRMNQKIKAPNKSSKYKGVSWNKLFKKWEVYIHAKGRKKIVIGYFNDEKIAAKAYNSKSKELYGDFASINTV